jgi:vWA-MoxR associated protein C-terminal domain/Trypsin-like peptidase domain
MSEGELRALLRECVVQVDRDGSPAGSGFFAAPGYVVSCAHVVQRAEGDAVHGQWRDTRWTGVVIYSSRPPDEPDIWPEPDLAIIRLDDGVLAEHPCVRLATTESAFGATMVADGRGLPYGTEPAGFATVRIEYTGMTGYLMRLGNEPFRSGLSGGPVLDLNTGYVSGIAKLTGRDGTDGYAVPARRMTGQVRQLRDAHDKYHAEHHDWTQQQEALWRAMPATERGVLPPTFEAQLLGLLTGLPPLDTAELSSLQHECAQIALPRTPDDLRDLALQLARLSYRDDRPHPVVILGELLARLRPAQADAFTHWSHALAARHDQYLQLLQWRQGQASAPRQADTRLNPRSVMVMLAPDAADPHLYRVTVWRNREALVKVREYTDPVGLLDIKDLLRSDVRQVLGELKGPRKIIEFILPLELWDEPVHDWPMAANDLVTFGSRYPVVIRDFDLVAIDDEDLDHARVRWEALAGLPGVAVTWPPYQGLTTKAEVYKWFAHNPGALGLTGQAVRRADLIEGALTAGVRIAIWRLAPPISSTACTGAPGCTCPACQFHDTINADLSGRGTYDLPEYAMNARGSLSDLAILWDNPYTGPRPRGLAVEWTG